jgi:hypothetical protein
MAATAKNIRVAPIARQDADRIIKQCHYSGKVVNNSQLHLGVFLDGRLEGAMQFGPSLDKRKIQGLVEGTGWNEFIELNRMAFSDRLPRNSESRAMAVAFRLIRKQYPHLKWVISFADGAQCGDGTIYRAASFVLTSIKRNTQIWEAPTGDTFSRTSLTDGRSKQQQQQQAVRLCRVSATKGSNVLETGAASMKSFAEAGFKPIPGFQLRYIYFLDPTYRQRLTVPVLPFSEIEKRGARMYKGQRVGSDTNDTPAVQAGKGGVTPTPTLQTTDAKDC